MSAASHCQGVLLPFIQEAAHCSRNLERFFASCHFSQQLLKSCWALA